jgi:hypothetical protein
MESAPDETGGFEDLAWLFTCDSRNRGLIRQGFDEAALLWKAVKATSGNILETGRNLAGSTVLLAAAADPSRAIYSIDNRSNENAVCKDFLARSENKARVRLLVADSRVPLPDLRFGLLFIDGDHTFEGVLADVIAHWNALQSHDGRPPLAAFHDALPNENFKWRDEDRRLKRWTIRVKNKFRKKQQPEIAPAYEPGVRVAENRGSPGEFFGSHAPGLTTFIRSTSRGRIGSYSSKLAKPWPSLHGGLSAGSLLRARSQSLRLPKLPSRKVTSPRFIVRFKFCPLKPRRGRRKSTTPSRTATHSGQGTIRVRRSPLPI